MKLLISLSLFFLACMPCIKAQSNYPYALEVVKFDAISKRVDKIPFDKPFIVEIENLSSDGVSKIYVFETEYNKKELCFKRRKADIIVPITEDNIKEKKITFTLPPLQPQKHFTLMIIRKESQPWDKTLDLNKAIYSELKNFHTIRDKDEIEKIFTKLKKNYDGSFCNTPTSSVIPGVIDDYLAIYDKGLFEKMDAVYEFKGMLQPNTINVTRLQHVATELKACCKAADSATFLQFCNQQVSMNLVAKGLIKLSDVSMGQELDTFDVQKRIANLKSSLSTLETIKKQVGTILSMLEADNKDIICDMDTLMSRLVSNKKNLEDLLKKATKILDNNFFYNEVIISTTFSKELATESNNRFLLDLGLANIGANDNRDKFTYIPKLAWGVNIYFRPVDKTVPLRTLPGSVFSGKYKDSLVAGKSIWHVVSLYVGFTIGSMSNPEFDNFYNNTSIMVGPSLKLYRAFRISAGPSFLRRVNPNPIITKKEITMGVFGSLSVDLDLLKSINSITSILAK